MALAGEAWYNTTETVCAPVLRSRMTVLDTNHKQKFTGEKDDLA